MRALLAPATCMRGYILAAYQNWTKRVIANGTAKDPSAAWQTKAGEWRFRDNTAMIYSSSNFRDWKRVGILGAFATGDCPSLFALASGSNTDTDTEDTEGGAPTKNHVVVGLKTFIYRRKHWAPQALPQ